MMNRFRRNFLVALTLGGMLLDGSTALAKPSIIDTMRAKISESTILAGAEEDPDKVAGILISTLLSVLGVLFLVLVIAGGYLWMTARGNEEQIGKAKKIILSASIGLAIVVCAYLITFVALEFLLLQSGL